MSLKKFIAETDRHKQFPVTGDIVALVVNEEIVVECSVVEHKDDSVTLLLDDVGEQLIRSCNSELFPIRLAEGQFKDIDLQLRDYKNLSPNEFRKMHKMTKAQWHDKYKSVLPSGVKESVAGDDYDDDKDFDDFDVDLADGDHAWTARIYQQDGKWREQVIDGNPPDGFGQQGYMGYLTPDDILSWLRRDYKYAEIINHGNDSEIVNETSYQSDLDPNKKVVVYGVKGMKSTPFTKTFKNLAAAEKWLDSDVAQDYKIRHIMNESNSKQSISESSARIKQLAGVTSVLNESTAGIKEQDDDAYSFMKRLVGKHQARIDQEQAERMHTAREKEAKAPPSFMPKHRPLEPKDEQQILDRIEPLEAQIRDLEHNLQYADGAAYYRDLDKINAAKREVSMLRAKLRRDIPEAEYQGREVTLNKPSPGDVKKYKVFVKDPKTGNVKKVNFGDPDMKIRRDNPEARKNFRARHGCGTDRASDKTKAAYWSCKMWSSKPVSKILKGK